MNDALEQKLFNRFKFYRPELSEHVSLMCYGFCVNDGWFNLIWDLSEAIDEEINNYYADKPNELAKAYLSEDYKINVFQVKEKFGGLRFYIDVEDNELYKKIQLHVDEAEGKSYKTCERCGKSGKIVRNGWVTVICDTCIKKQKGSEKHAKRIRRISEGTGNNKFIKRKKSHYRKTR